MRFAVLVSLAAIVAAPAASSQSIGPGYGYPGNFGGSSDPAGQLSTQTNINSGGGRAWTTPVATARILIEQGRYAAAARLLSGPHVRQGKETRFLKGVSSLGMGDADTARRHFSHVARADNYREPSALTGLAAAELELGNVSAARDILGTLKEQQAKCKGECRRAKSLDRAVAALEKALV